MSRLLLLLAVIAIAFSASSYIRKDPPAKASKNLVFPVADKKSRVGSFWGDVRDGGRRKHEGIDIFAKKGTPVVAIADGIIVSRGNGGIGGKTLWLQTHDYPWNVYYAHLDAQKVRVGQQVKKGQVIGTVGKTGNARTTPPHLHFGIYNWDGPINPFPYVKRSRKINVPVQSRGERHLAKTQKNKRKSGNNNSYDLPERYRLKTVRLKSDPRGKYYVTTRANVVRVANGKMAVVGKWKKQSHKKYPYQLSLHNKKLLVNRSGKLVTTSGIQVGTVI